MNTARKPEHKFDKPTEAMPGILFQPFSRLVILLNWAKSGCWCRDLLDRTQREVDWFAIRTKIDFNEHGQKRYMHELILGPFLLIVGWDAP